MIFATHRIIILGNC